VVAKVSSLWELSLFSVAGNQQGVRKRSRRRKKPIGVGTISENTKRILLEHIPDASERKR